MNPPRIRLFVKPYCTWCHQAVTWLNDQSVPYDCIDVMQNPKAFAEMQRISGQTYAPVLDVDGRILADFGLPELEAFWRSTQTNAKA